MKKILLISLTFFLCASSFEGIAQTTTNSSFRVTNQGNEEPLLKYLFDTYGIEASEQVLLNMVAYQTTENVFVLFGNRYKDEINRMNKALSKTSSIAETQDIENEKNKLVAFSAIEHLLTK